MILKGGFHYKRNQQIKQKKMNPRKKPDTELWVRVSWCVLKRSSSVLTDADARQYALQKSQLPLAMMMNERG